MSNDNEKKSFRDSLATVDDDGNRKWVYPKKPSGKYYNYRQIVAYLLLAVLFAGPFIRINGNPLLLFNIIERKFVIFGNIFAPQDFYIFMFVMIVGIVAVGIFTLVFGRLFCGWVCPQTIFMEMVFRKIEYWIEGDWNKQKALNKAPWTPKKIFKKTLKHILFFGVSFLISNTFLAYVIGTDQLYDIIIAPPSEHWTGFISIFIFSILFYIVFSRLREQICTSVCPYGRLQGVLLDKHSIVVAYDYNRGEKRGKFRKKENRDELGKGDCVDCKQCINVCPTGIDIRNGTQLECIHCTACIDACDNIMDKLSMPGGLIRYTSEHHIEHKTEMRLNKRTIGFSILILILTGVMFSLLFFRNNVGVSILRKPGTLFDIEKDGKISNTYHYKLMNKSNDDITISFKLLEHTGSIKTANNNLIELEKMEKKDGSLDVLIEESSLQKRRTDIKIGIFKGEEKIDEISTVFLSKNK